MRKYAHVGYAKAASTWLQAFLFPHHPDLFHFGRHNGDEIIDDELRIALWNDLIMQPSFLYQSEQVAAAFERLFARAAQSKAAACGISQEVLTLSFVGGLDITERARRLRAAMGEGTHIVIVIRNQFDWISSVFCALLKEGGMPYGLDDFLFYFYYQQDQSPFCTLFYDNVYELYADLFGADNVHVVPFELIKRDVRVFAAKVCEAIGVTVPADVPTEGVNRRPSPEALTAYLDYNRKSRFYLGADHFRRPWGMAAAPLFRKRFGIDPPRWMIEEHNRSTLALKRIEPLVRAAQEQGHGIPPMDTTLPVHYRDLLARAYAPHNRRVMQLAGVDVGTLGYPV